MQALSTGQVARYCLVSPETIQNWIHDRGLPAERTAGGQYRVRPHDLRRFMIEHGMSVAELDRALFKEEQPRCWEFFAAAPDHAGQTRECETCVVYRAEALRCYELRHYVDHRHVHCPTDDCAACPYHQRYAAGEPLQAPTNGPTAAVT